MLDQNQTEAKRPADGRTGETGWMRHNRLRDRVYLVILIVVVMAGLPMVTIPAVRARLQSRIQTLRSAWIGEPVPPAPAFARVGENHEPFPQAYERASVPPLFPPGMDMPKTRQPFIISGSESEATPPSAATGSRPLVFRSGGAGSPARGQAQTAQAAVPAEKPGSDTSGEPQYRKGPGEQEAYDILVASSQTLAGMIQGKDPALKFQDWSAADMGENSYYVMVAFVQTADDVVRKYIWRVKVGTKEVSPLSAYAMAISK